MARLGDICEIVSGTTPKSNIPEYWDGDINWVTPAELNDETTIIYESQRKITKQAVEDSSLKSFPAGTVLLSSRAPIGKVAIAGVEMYCNQGFKNLICSDKIHNKYLFWFLKDRTDYLNSLGRGATFKEISKSIVENIEIPLPPIKEQKRYATTLDKLGGLISLRKQQLAKLDEVVKARFVEMFGKRNYPEVCIADVVDRNILSAKKKFSSTDIIKYVDISSINNQSNTMTGYTEHIFSDAPSRAQQCIEEGDILISTVRPNLKNIAQNKLNYKNLVASSGFCILRPTLCQAFYLMAIVLSEKFTDDMVKATTGANYPAIKDSDILKYRIPLAPDDQQQQFALFAGKVDRQKLTIQQSLDKLEVMKKSLMQEYFG